MSELSQRAIEKLRKQTEELENKRNRESMKACNTLYLEKRCEEDEGLCEDILQEHKTVGKCLTYIFNKVLEEIDTRERNGRVNVMADNESVYEAIEDYYRMDDKAKEAAEAAERRKKEEEKRRKRQAEAARKTKAAKKPAAKAAEKPVQKKKTEDVEGQMDIFSIIGAQEG